jgi:hypothetical protein
MVATGETAWYPQGPIRIGDSWLDSTVLAGEPTAVRVRTWRFERIEARDGQRAAFISMAGTVKQLGSSAPRGWFSGTYEISIEDGWIRAVTTTSVSTRRTPEGEELVKVESRTESLDVRSH